MNVTAPPSASPRSRSPRCSPSRWRRVVTTHAAGSRRPHRPPATPFARRHDDPDTRRPTPPPTPTPTASSTRPAPTTSSCGSAYEGGFVPVEVRLPQPADAARHRRRPRDRAGPADRDLSGSAAAEPAGAHDQRGRHPAAAGDWPTSTACSATSSTPTRRTSPTPPTPSSTITANGDTYVHQAYALGLGGDGTETDELRQALADVRRRRRPTTAAAAGANPSSARSSRSADRRT